MPVLRARLHDVRHTQGNRCTPHVSYQNHSGRLSMSYRNYIHLTSAERQSPVYRIMSAKRVADVLRNECLTLVKPKLWDDPFENALLSSAFSMSQGEQVGFSAKDAVYGQCWTRHRETDAMWRIYSHAKDGVRLTSSPRRLVEALSASDSKFAAIRAFIGKVKYYGKNKLLKALSEIHLLDPNGSGVAESLLYKRWEFRHEAEVRLIYCGPDRECQNDLHNFSVDPNTIFDKLLCDPRMHDTAFRLHREEFRDLGFRGTIERSGLYKPPQGLIFKL